MSRRVSSCSALWWRSRKRSWKMGRQPLCVKKLERHQNRSRRVRTGFTLTRTRTGLVPVPPVEVGHQAQAVPVQQLAQQLLVPAEQAQVVPHWEGLQGQTGEALHQLQVAQLQPEVVPALRCSCHNRFILQRHTEENLTGSGPFPWQ